MDRRSSQAPERGAPLSARDATLPGAAHTRVEAIPAARPSRRLSMSRREALWFYIFLSPWLVGLALFTAWPILSSFYFSFTNYRLLGLETHFLGLRNYYLIFTRDPVFWEAVRVTITYAAVSVPLVLTLSLVAALLVNTGVRGVGLFRTLFFIPSQIPGFVMVLVFSVIFEPRYGLLNQALELIGIQGPAWFQNPDWQLPSLIMISSWGFGGGMVIFLAGLQDVPQSLYEAATIDGATAWQRFRRITLPLISPVMFFNVVMGFIGGLQVFQQGYALNSLGGHGLMINFWVVYIFNIAFSSPYRMGYAAALSVLLMALIALITAAIALLGRRLVFYQA